MFALFDCDDYPADCAGCPGKELCDTDTDERIRVSVQDLDAFVGSMVELAEYSQAESLREHIGKRSAFVLAGVTDNR